MHWQRKICCLYGFLRYFATRFYTERVFRVAASLAYTSILSFAPLIMLILALLGNLPMAAHVDSTVQQFIFDNFVPAVGETVYQYIEQFSKQSYNLTLTGIISLIVIALLLLATIEDAFNRIWQITEKRRLLSRFLMYWAILTLGPILLGVGFLSASYVFSISLISDIDNSLQLRNKLLGTWLPFLTTSTAFSLMYALIPNCRLPIKHALLGGLTAALLFECSKYAFEIYIKQFASYSSIYGTLSTIPIFLIWLYLSWSIILCGAYITCCLSSYAPHATTTNRSASFVSGFLLLAKLYAASKSGHGLSIEQLGKQNTISPLQINTLLTVLAQAKWVQKNQEQQWFLARDLRRVHLQELYHILPGKLPTDELDELLYDDSLAGLQRHFLRHQQDFKQILSVSIYDILTTDTTT